MTVNRGRQWLVDILAGGVIGGVCGAIVGWNVSIFLGVPAGYEAGLGEVLSHSLLGGILWLAAVISGPLVGIAIVRWQRQKRKRRDDQRMGSR